MNEETVDYNKYTFEPGKELTITVEMLNIINKKVRKLLETERLNLVPLKFKLYDTNKQQFVSKKTKVNSQYVREVFDPEATMNAKIQESITPEGQELLRVISVLDAIHISNVDRGNGILLSELAENRKSEMKIEDGQ